MSDTFWALVPAAGVGRRMGAAIPKQYLPLAGSTVLDLSLQRLLEHPRIQGLYLALSADDEWWPGSRFAADSRVQRVDGGAERCHSVLNALQALSQQAETDAWVLVHDAARPCLRPADLDALIAAAATCPDGALLGLPVRDTMKRSDEQGQIRQTVERNRLWHAFTPQMFRLGPLYQALRQALEQGQLVTDEASAMELAGYRPQLIEGHADNLKITRPEDLALAAFYLQRQEEGRCA
ncbi:MAG: 2-C-methyl-D-erythritol 4-phosphate cytidylyltransferase [Gammaproteobacteria bacterium SHHR-1]|uniref:2-C-methyl-D-erythritol 4-phosphate cytidylyltransferase n=1 Tax=Magnetovirga frankeli TaxID=947516 RepID=UPI0012939CCE|nr:2-C-methyl-D-erythritol 4-phosphate cytidylyltransferase [gamma proteobacterium SS-5]